MQDPSRARVTGPLQPYAEGFTAELARLGYTAESAYGQMLLMAHVSRWLAGEGLDAGGLTPETADRFLAARRAAGYVLYLSPKALVPLLGFLRRTGRGAGGAAACSRHPQTRLLGRYRRYLVTERGLAAETAADYAAKVRAVPGRPRWSRPGGPDGGRGDRVHRGDVPVDAEGHGEADGDRAAVAAGLAARGGRDSRARWPGRFPRSRPGGWPRCRRRWSRPRSGRCWTAATRARPPGAGTWRCSPCWPGSGCGPARSPG